MLHCIAIFTFLAKALYFKPIITVEEEPARAFGTVVSLAIKCDTILSGKSSSLFVLPTYMLESTVAHKLEDG
jgi:hypothetical protein